MTDIVAFDTHRYVKRLTESGFTESQAEALVEGQVALLNANLATKTDIARIEAGMEALRQETAAGIARVEAGMDALRQETSAGMDALRQETSAEIARVEAGMDALRQETSASMDALRQETSAEIARVEAGMDALRQETRVEIARIEGRIEAAKSDLLKWLFGALIAQGGLIIALIKLL